MSGSAILFQGMSYRIGGKEILSSIDLDVRADERVCILGPNGSGKSSLIRIIRGEARPWTGDPSMVCELFGRRRWNIFDLRSYMGVVVPELERSISPRTTAWDLVASGLFQSYGVYRCHHIGDDEREVTDHTLHRLGMEGFAEREVSTLSSGEMRKVMIARALVNDPLLLLLDEPMTGLDIIARKMFRDSISRLASLGKGVVMATHDLEDIVPEFDRVVMLKDGKVFKDGPKEEVLTDENMSSLFGVEVRIVRQGPNYLASVL